MTFTVLVQTPHTHQSRPDKAESCFQHGWQICLISGLCIVAFESNIVFTEKSYLLKSTFLLPKKANPFVIPCSCICSRHVYIFLYHVYIFYISYWYLPSSCQKEQRKKSDRDCCGPGSPLDNKRSGTSGTCACGRVPVLSMHPSSGSLLDNQRAEGHCSEFN